MANPSDLARRAAEPDPATPAEAQAEQHHRGLPRDLWPHEFGRDGVTGLVTVERAMRARDVSRPTAADIAAAAEVVPELLARIDGRRPPGRPYHRPQRPDA